MAPGHDLGPDPVLRIGDRCVIGRGSHVVAHLSIDIGDDVFTGPYVYITDQNHSYADPDLPIGRQWPVNAPVRIGAGTWLGTGAIVLPGSVIGRNVVVAAGAVVRGVIGDRCVVAGVPARVVKDFDTETGWTRSMIGAVGPRSETASAGSALAGTALAGTPPAGTESVGNDRPEATSSAREPAEALLTEPTLTETALTETALSEPVLSEVDLTEPMVLDQPSAHPLLAEQDS